MTVLDATSPLIPTRNPTGSSRMGRLLAVAAAIVSGWAGTSDPLRAQSSEDEGWNSPRALELAELGREARRGLDAGGDLSTYRAETRGNIYFYLDPEEGDQRPLLRTDQVAVDLYWMAPGLTRQVIVGHHKERHFPIRDFQYFLDRLTVVQHGFGDRIHVGEGMDVRDVPHPLAATEADDRVYDIRLADSVRITLPEEPEPIRVYELQVRPKDPDEPAIVGSLFLEGSSGHLVRMDFTFTPSSYVDPRNDRVHISLEYGRWEGEHWLPHEQTVEVRREIPRLDLGVGTIILAVLRTGSYEFDVPLEREFFQGPRVTTRPQEELEAYDFPTDPLAELRDRDLAGSLERVEPSELRRQGRQLVGSTRPSGLPAVRFHLPDASSALRFNRAEGWRAGGGVQLGPFGLGHLRLSGGYAFGSSQVSGTAGTTFELTPETRVEVRGTYRHLSDLGPIRGADGMFNSVASSVTGHDYLDPFHRSGGYVRLVHQRERGLRVTAEARGERHSSLDGIHTSAPLGGRALRPIRPVDPGTLLSARLGLSRERGGPLSPSSWKASMEAGRGPVGSFIRTEGSAALRLKEERPGSGLHFRLHGGTAAGSPPLQRHFLLGGRHTVPGHPYRSFAGRHYMALSLEGARDLAHPWLRLRTGVWAGAATELRDRVARDWNVSTTGGARFGVTGGVGLFYDLLRVEGARGAPDGEWQILVYVDPAWWERL